MAVRPITTALQSAAAAIQFLTRLPLPVAVPFDRRTVSRSVVFFPLAGALIGLITVCAGGGLAQLLPPLPAAAVTLALWTALSGGLHLDGWMDTADGVLSHRPRERMLDIMRDSRVGAMGVMAGTLLLLVKFAALAALFEAGLPPFAAAALLAVPVWSRWWMAVSIAAWPYARKEDGLGALFGGAGAGHAAAAAAVGAALTLSAWLAAAHIGGAPTPALWAGGAPGAFALLLAAAGPLAAALFGLPLAVWLNRKLGGLTGDTYGALNEWVEAGLLLVIAAAL